MRVVFLAAAVSALLPRTRGQATLYRALTPVSANETALFSGSRLTTAASVRFCDAALACASAPLLAPASITVRAAVPASLSRTSTLNATILDASGGALLSTVLNAPIVDWWQGSGATPSVAGAPGALFGERLRLVGRNLAWVDGACLPFTKQASPVAPTVRVRAAPLGGGAPLELRVLAASCYRIEVALPAAGAPGSYAISVSTGLTGPGIGAAGFTTVIADLGIGFEAWPAAVFFLNVSGVPAPSPHCNSVGECIATAGAAGGGTVVAPAANIIVCEQWIFPNNVALRGAGRGKTVFWWPSWCGTPVTFDPADDPNTSGGLPIVAGAPGARWKMADMDLYGQAFGGRGYQPVLGTDFVALGYSHKKNAGSGGSGGSSARIERVNITFDLRATPAIQIGNAFAAYGAFDFSLVDSFISHRGSCSAQWPHNCAAHITNSSNGEIRGVVMEMGCQAYAIESSSRMYIADTEFVETNVWTGTDVQSSNGGVEFSTIDPPHVSELHYMANCSYTGNVKAAERWESFTTDGGADAFYNETVAAQVANPDGTATLTLASPVLMSEFYYEWARGNAVTVVQGPSVGQVRRLVDVIAPDNTTIVISAPFDPPLSPTDDIVAITSYRGGFIFEGNRYLNGTCFQFYGGIFDTIVSGNSLNEMGFDPTWVPTAPDPATGFYAGEGAVGGGGRVYATSYQQEAYNIWEHNEVRCVESFMISMGNLENGETVRLPNATYNFAQIVRKNEWAGIGWAQMLFTHDHVVEFNHAGDAVCVYNGGKTVPTAVSTDNPTNSGMVYRPGPQTSAPASLTFPPAGSEAATIVAGGSADWLIPPASWEAFARSRERRPRVRRG